MELLHKELTGRIIKVFYSVYNELGYGFLERVYQNALYIELNAQALKWKRKKESKFIIKTTR